MDSSAGRVKPVRDRGGVVSGPWDAGAEMLANRITKNRRRLEGRLRREDVHAWRAYDRDIPELPLVVEVLGDAVHLASFAHEDRIDPVDSDARLEVWRLAASRALDVPTDRVFAKRHRRQRRSEQYGHFDDAAVTTLVEEGGLQFEVNLSELLDTGLFLDHRNTRRRVREEARGRRMLNLFSYTGAFTVHAARGGARTTTSVDLSNRYLAQTQRNLAINGLLNPFQRGVRADVMAWLLDAARAGERFDLAVVDPPTFSNSKRSEHDFVVQRDHVRLLARTVRLLTPGAILYFSNNFRGFSLDPGLMDLAEGKELTPASIPPDFRDRRVHRCWRFEVDLFLGERLDELERRLG